jgi:hypothetical protein
MRQALERRMQRLHTREDRWRSASISFSSASHDRRSSSLASSASRANP